MLLILDPFDDFVEDELGHWLIRSCLRLPDTLTVVARLPGDQLLDDPRIVHRPLPPFTLEEVRAFLLERRKGVSSRTRLTSLCTTTPTVIRVGWTWSQP